MEFTLRKIKKDKFNEVCNSVINNYTKTHKIEVDNSLLEESSEEVRVNGNTISVFLDIDGYNAILEKDGYTYTKNAEIGMKLHKELKDINGVDIPKYYFYEKELWAYISLTAFADIVKRMRLDDDDKINVDKIRRFYFNVGGLSRTGLMFVWAMVDRLDSEDKYELTHTAFEFIDPVKAILERTMSRNPNVFKAFVQGILNNNQNPKFKHKDYRLKVPNNISCYAAVNFLDDYDYDELVKLVTEQQAILIK